MKGMDADGVISVLRAMCRRMEAEKDFLTELDNVIADGDHGINMARGFAAVERKLPELSGKDLGAVLKTVGLTLVSAVGGSAGPLYGTMFLKSGMAMAGKTEIALDDFLVCLKLSIDGVQQRGHAVRGEKTMLDAMIPAWEAMTAARTSCLTSEAVLDAGIAAAHNGVEYTKTIVATKGRASYIGERSLGHQDPGATSFAFLLETVAASRAVLRGDDMGSERSRVV